jgi:hypothetical protein
MSWQRKLRVLPLAQLCLTLLVAGTLGCAELRIEDLTRILNTTGGLDEATVSDGLRQALTVGTERASGQLSAPGGFGDSPTLRLVLPDQLDPMVTTARTLGFGSTIDSLETGMNRAAEAAAGEAVPVFANAIAAMSIQDAFRILRGPDDAATEYFRAQTSEPLRARFAPVVRSSMERVGLYAQYKSLVDRYAARSRCRRASRTT